METLFLHYIEVSRLAAYMFIFVGLLLEGELILFIAVLLSRLGFLDAKVLILIALFGVMLGDYLWYRLGTILADKHNRVTVFARKAGRIFSNSITTHPFRILTISKFTYGLHRSTIVLFGINKVSQKTFVRADFVAAALWLMVVWIFAAVTSLSLSSAKHFLKYTEFFLFVAVIIWYGLLKYTTKIFKNYR